MPFVLTPYVGFYALTALVSLWVAVIAWRRRGQPGAKSMVAITLAVSWTCLTGAIALGVVGIDAKLRWAKVCYPGSLVAPVALLLFAFELRRVSTWLRPTRIILLAVVPTLAWVAALTNERHHLVWTGYHAGPAGSNLVAYDHGPWFWWGAVGYSYACMVVGSVMLVQVARGFSRLHRWRMALVLFAVALPWLCNAVYVAGFVPIPFDVTPIAFLASSAIFSWMLVASRLADLLPLAGRRLIEMLPDAVLVFDAADRLAELNPAARRWLRLEERGLPALHLQQLLPANPAWQAALAAPTPGVHEIIEPTSERRTLEFELLNLAGAGGRREGRLLIVRDITTRKRAEAVRIELERRALRAEKHESLGLFAGGVAHDFNNLMTVVLGRLSLIELEVSADPALRQELREAGKAARLAADVARQILLYTGDAFQEFRVVDLAEIARDASNRLRTELPPEIRLEFASPVGVPLIRGESTQIAQACSHLLTNAREAIGERPGVITLSVIRSEEDGELPEAWVQESPGLEPYVALEVADTGGGMDEATRHRMFEPFFSTKAFGRGLGLAAVWGIARGHGAWIAVATVPGCGTRVRLAFPVKGAPAARATSAGPSAALNFASTSAVPANGW